jgi:hypothetical protein
VSWGGIRVEELAIRHQLLADLHELSVTQFNSCPELSNQRSARFKSPVEFGCMACEICALSASALGLTLINCGPGGTALHAEISITAHSSKLLRVCFRSRIECVRCTLGVMGMLFFLVRVLSPEPVRGLVARYLVCIPFGLDLGFSVIHSR